MSLGIETRQEHEHGISPWEAGLLGVVGVGMIRFAELADPALTLRDKLPEPIDFMDHIGNPAALTSLGLGTAHVYSIYRDEKVVTEQDQKKHNRRFAVMVGLGTVAANTYGEIVGYGYPSTPDPIDFAYGLLAGIAIYKVGKTDFKSEEVVDEQFDMYKEKVEELEGDSSDDGMCHYERMSMLSKMRRKMYKFMRYKEKIDEHKSKFKDNSAATASQ